MKASTSAGTGPVRSVTGLSAESVASPFHAQLAWMLALLLPKAQVNTVLSDKIDFPAVQVQESTGAGQNRNRHAVL